MYFTTRQLCHLTGVPFGTLKRLRAAGSVLAAKPGTRGRGHTDLWTPSQVLALAVARGLRSGGVVAADAEAVLQFLWRCPAARLEEAFQAGRTCLMLGITPAGTHCLPTLVTRAAILDHETSTAPPGTALSLGVSPSALDVQAIWRFIRAQADTVGVTGRRRAQATRKAK